MKPEWVRVAERSPETGGRYLGVVVLYKGASPEVVIVVANYYPECDGPVWAIVNGAVLDDSPMRYSPMHYPYITHWAPLPETPEEGG